jgi:hypothetical protein
MKAPRVLLFVLDRGFVVVGLAEPDPDLAFHWLLKPGRTVRRWGTSNGLAELVRGPTADTVLDDPATRHVPFRSVIEILEVDERAWRTALALTGD